MQASYRHDSGTGTASVVMRIRGISHGFIHVRSERGRHRPLIVEHDADK